MRGMWTGRTGLAIVLGLVTALAGGIGVAAAASVTRPHHTTRPTHRGLRVGQVRRDTKATSKRVIVILRSQGSASSLSGARGRRGSASALAAQRRAQAPVAGAIRASGGRVGHRFRLLNALTARVGSAGLAHLQASDRVAKVIPDSRVQAPGTAPAAGAHAAQASPGGAPIGTPPAGVCPTDPSRPILEPEALETTNTTAAQTIATGKGVKVAILADGLDPNNPDLIRANGQHVIADYQDFTGDGPNAPSGAAEAFGDASSIGAQGRQTYDLSTYTNSKHPLPKGCTIQVKGFAPDASIYAMKVFGNASSSYNSTILQGLDYAVYHDHVDILSESFGGYPVPDSLNDLTRTFNRQAIAAGVTVSESTGDSGVEASVSSAGSEPGVIAAGASTNFRAYAQTIEFGFNFAKGYASDQISSLSSAGFAQNGKLTDLVAPGEVGWSLCSPNIKVYIECTDLSGEGSPLQQFGGTSQSAPFIAGAAANVIQAYKDGHGGQRPDPATVKRLLTGTSRDLGLPAAEQGSGELNTLRAVRAARGIGENGVVVDPGQITTTGQPGTTQTKRITVTNTGTKDQVVRTRTRQVGGVTSNQTGSVALNAQSPTYVDGFGTAVPYRKVDFDVPAGTDRLVHYDSWAGPKARIGVALIDPNGVYTAYTRPQGNGNHGQVDVHAPKPGHWTAIVFKRDGDFSGPVNYQFVTQRYGDGDGATPSAVTVPAGQSRKVDVDVTLPNKPGDSAEDAVVSASGGQSTVVSLIRRSLVPVKGKGGTFSGTLVGGNGRDAAALQPGQLNTFDFDVPAGKPALTTTLRFPEADGTQVRGALIDPDGNAVSVDSTTRTNAAGNAIAGNALTLSTESPRAGRWRFVLDEVNPVGGKNLSQPFTARIGLAGPHVTTKGLPKSAGKTLARGKPVTATVRVRNAGPATRDLFLDARLPQRRTFSLYGLSSAVVRLPVPSGTTPPIFLNPTETTQLDAAAEATVPVAFNFGFGSGDPDVASVGTGKTATASYASRETSAGLWAITPTAVGPFSGAAPKGIVATGVAARTLDFDFAAEPSTGDVEQQAVDPNAGDFTPVTVKPGAQGTLKLKITPTAKAGTTVRGTLYVDSFSSTEAFTSELVGIPYEYTVR